MAPTTESERGCGCGCAMALLAVGIILLCILLPWVGLPLGLMAAVAAVVVAWLSGKGPFAPNEVPSAEVIEIEPVDRDSDA